MTLIALATGRNHADILTDTSSYSYAGGHLGHCSKVQTLPHLDAAVVTQGSAAFGRCLRVLLDAESDQTPDLDALVCRMAELGRRAWQAALAEGCSDPGPSVAFLVGHSAERQGFTAHAVASDDGFTPCRVDGLHVMPSPTDSRPSDLELHRLDGWVHDEDLAVLRSRPRPRVPSTPQQWVQLAQQVREQRALMPYPLKVLVYGKVFHTRLARGQSHTTLVHTFNDSGEEFQRMVAGTLHPQGQLGACPCGSGRRYLDCCLAGRGGESCLCGSGRPFGECCRVDATLDACEGVAGVSAFDFGGTA